MDLDEKENTFKLGLFAFTGKVILEPIYKKIEIQSDVVCFENYGDIKRALLNDVIIVTDFDDKKYVWTHHHGLEEDNSNLTYLSE